MWYSEIIAVGSEINAKYILTIYRENAKLLNAEATGLQRVNFNPSYVIYLATPSLDLNAYLFKFVLLLYRRRLTFRTSSVPTSSFMRMLCTASPTETGVSVFGTTRSKYTRTHRGVDFLSGADGSNIPASLHGHPEQHRTSTLRFTIDRRSPLNCEIFRSIP